jgi:hypothetical protein
MKNNMYIKLLAIALMASFGVVKPTEDSEFKDILFPNLSNEELPGPAIFGSDSKSPEHSKSPAQHLLGTDTASRPSLTDEQMPFAHFTDEQLQELFKQEPKVAKTPEHIRMQQYIGKLEEVITNLSKENENLLDHYTNVLTDHFMLQGDHDDLKKFNQQEIEHLQKMINIKDGAIAAQATIIDSKDAIIASKATFIASLNKKIDGLRQQVDILRHNNASLKARLDNSASDIKEIGV